MFTVDSGHRGWCRMEMWCSILSVKAVVVHVVLWKQTLKSAETSSKTSRVDLAKMHVSFATLLVTNANHIQLVEFIFQCAIVSFHVRFRRHLPKVTVSLVSPKLCDLSFFLPNPPNLCRFSTFFLGRPWNLKISKTDLAMTDWDRRICPFWWSRAVKK